MSYCGQSDDDSDGLINILDLKFDGYVVAQKRYEVTDIVLNNILNDKGKTDNFAAAHSICNFTQYLMPGRYKKLKEN